MESLGLVLGLFAIIWVAETTELDTAWHDTLEPGQSYTWGINPRTTLALKPGQIVTEADLATGGRYAGNSVGRVHPVGQRQPNARNLSTCTAMSLNSAPTGKGLTRRKPTPPPLGLEPRQKRIPRDVCFK